MHQTPILTEMEAKIAQIKANGSPGRYPSSAIILGRAVLKHAHGRWVGIRSPVPLADLGVAAKTLELTGFGWHDLSSPEQVVTQAEVVRNLTAHPLVIARQLPMGWLVGDNGMVLGVDGLAAIGTAIELAETHGEDWRLWVKMTTAVAVIAWELPRLQALVEAKVEIEPTVEVEITIGAPAPIVIVDHTHVPAIQSEQRLRGKARKDQRRQEADARKAQADTRALVAKSHKRGEVFEDNGKRFVICTAFRCGRPVLLTEARVAKSIGSIMNALRVRRFDAITEGNLPMVSFCKECASHILQESVTIPEALLARDAKIAQAEAFQAKVKAEREAEAARKAEADRKAEAQHLQRLKATCARTGGAFGKQIPSWMSGR